MSQVTWRRSECNDVSTLPVDPRSTKRHYLHIQAHRELCILAVPQNDRKTRLIIQPSTTCFVLHEPPHHSCCRAPNLSPVNWLESCFLSRRRLSHIHRCNIEGRRQASSNAEPDLLRRI